MNAAHDFDVQNERYVVKPSFARHVRFETHNLVDPHEQTPSPGKFDLVLCRNVSIYFFTDDGVAALYRKLASALTEDGLRIIAASDARPKGTPSPQRRRRSSNASSRSGRGYSRGWRG